MEKFVISPEDCLILKAFRDSKSLREAAVLLSCDPAGLARKVQKISRLYGFLQKVDNRWQVTGRGLDLVAWTESSIQSQRKILSAKSSLRIATTMWFSEEVLLPNMSGLLTSFGPETSFSVSVPHKEFELSLTDGTADYVIVCHPPSTPEIEHKQVLEEKWCLIAPSTWKKDLKNFRDEKALSLLTTKPFVRHTGMNHELFLPNLAQLNEAPILVDHLIGIRSAVCEGHGWSLVPEILVRRHASQDRLLVVPYEIPLKDRKVCVWWLRNRYETKRQSGKVCSWVKESCS